MSTSRIEEVKRYLEERKNGLLCLLERHQNTLNITDIRFDAMDGDLRVDSYSSLYLSESDWTNVTHLKHLIQKNAEEAPIYVSTESESMNDIHSALQQLPTDLETITVTTGDCDDVISSILMELNEVDTKVVYFI